MLCVRNFSPQESVIQKQLNADPVAGIWVHGQNGRVLSSRFILEGADLAGAHITFSKLTPVWNSLWEY